MNLLQRYKSLTYELNKKYYCEYDEWFQPYFSWNPFDTRNDWQPKWLVEYMYGWSNFSYAWEAWSYCVGNKKYPYPYKLPDAFWLELNGIR